MKTLYILGSRISQYYKKNKLLFLLFLLGGILNAVSMIYCYGNLLPYIRDRASMDLKYRDYTVSFQYWETDERGSAIGDTPITNLPDPEDVLSFIAEPLLEGCEITAQNSVCTSTGNYPYTVVRGTTEFTGPYQVFVRQDVNTALGDTIDINGISFEVIGVFAGTITLGDRDLYHIPYETFVEMGYLNQVIRLDPLPLVRYDFVKDDPISILMESYFPDAPKGFPAVPKLELYNSYFEIPGILISALLSMIAYTCLLRYLVDSMINETIVAMIVGASKVRMTVYIFWETLLLSVGANVLGLLMHRVLYVPVFQKLNITENLSYTAADYVLILLVLLALSLLITIPFAMKYLKLSPIAARRERI